MSRFNLKNNPELAKERHRQQNREWYKKHKEQKMESQRIYRIKKKLRACGVPEDMIAIGVCDIFFEKQERESLKKVYALNLLEKKRWKKNVENKYC